MTTRIEEQSRPNTFDAPRRLYDQDAPVPTPAAELEIGGWPFGARMKLRERERDPWAVAKALERLRATLQREWEERHRWDRAHEVEDEPRALSGEAV